MAWYRTYRPQTVSELAITPVREQMQNILKTGKFAHAYLFAGPKGTGKTSTARILARILNEPKNTEKILTGKGPLKEPVSDDPVLRRIAQGKSQVVIEQDAASHRGIDDIRQLQEQVSVVPTEGFMRVVILDEVHMLTTEAFNALLKLLEEPPERVIFVLATTELHKVPATVQSRCQLVRFRQANTEEIQQVLQGIAKKEGISLDEQQALQLAEVSQGSFRDAVKNFEAIVEEGAVSDSLAESLFSGQTQSAELLKALAGKRLKDVSAFFQRAREEGQNFSILEQELFVHLQQRLHRAIERKEPVRTVRHICDLTTHLVERVGGFEPIEGIKLELACLSWCLPEDTGEGNSGEEGEPEEDPDEHPSGTVREKAADDVPISAPVSEGAQPVHLSRQEIEQTWPQFLLRVRSESQALESLLRNAVLGEITEATIELQMDLPFHKEKIESRKYAELLRQLLREQFHPLADFRVTLFQKAEPSSPGKKAFKEEDQLLAAVEAAVLSLEDPLEKADRSARVPAGDRVSVLH